VRIEPLPSPTAAVVVVVVVVVVVNKGNFEFFDVMEHGKLGIKVVKYFYLSSSAAVVVLVE